MNTVLRTPVAALAIAVMASCAALTAQAQSSSDQDEEGDEIVVTGTLRDSSPVDLAQPVTVMRGDALDRARAATLGETLAAELGVSSSYFGSGASRPIIRGLAGARVRTLEDGIDSLDLATTSDDHAVGIDPLVADQVEIFRGPTTLLYGSGAVGGVVNTVTSRIPKSVPGELTGAFELRGDSVSGGRDAALRLDGGADAFAWHFDALKRDSDDYEIPGFAEVEHGDEAQHEAEDGEHAERPGIVENSAVETDALAFGGSWIGERSLFGLSVSTFNSLYGVPGHHHHEDAGEEAGGEAEVHAEEEAQVRVDLEQTRIDLKGGWTNLEGAIEEIGLRIGFNDYEHVELEGADPGTRFTNHATELRLELLHKPLGAWSGAFGVQLGARDFAALGEEAFVPPVETRSYAVFLVEERELERWRVALGARLEAQKHSPREGLAVEGDATSVSFAAVRPLAAGRSLAANVAVAERVPVAEELFALPDVPHLATRMFQVGNSALGKERARHVDFGLRRSGDLRWSVTGFRTSYDDFIFLVDTGVIVDDLPVFAFTQGDVELKGIEAEVFAPIARVGNGEVDVRVFGDYVEGELANGEHLPRIPPLRYGARLQYDDARFVVGLAATRYETQDDTAPYEEPTAGYTMVDADFRWRIAHSRGMPVDLFVRASNVGDEEARKHTSFVKDVAPLPGRNFAVGVRASW